MAQRIRNIAIAGHGTCGKTTLLETLLALGRAIPRVGKVDDGTSILDHSSEERSHRFTVAATPCYIEHDGVLLQMLDTPGYADFRGAVTEAFAAVETALIAIDGSAGIRVNTRRVWDDAERAGLGRVIVIMRLDTENARFDELVEEIRSTFGKQCVPLEFPDEAGPSFSSVENVLETGATGSERSQRMFQQMREAIIESDESMMERYLAEEQISDAEVRDTFSTAVLSGAVVPILCCSSVKGIGINKLLHFLVSIPPTHDSAVQRKLVDAEGNESVGSASGSASDPLIAQVFKIELDPFVGKLSYVRIHSGTLTSNTPVQNLTRRVKEKVNTILRMQGKDHTTIESAGPGEIVALPKVEELSVGDCLGDGKSSLFPAKIIHPSSMVKLAVEPKNRNDETKLSEALNRLHEADPTFQSARIRSTHELVIAGRSSLHLDLILERLKDQFKIEVVTHVPTTAYLESIGGSSEAHHRHRKQTGGRGQFGEVYIRLAPADREKSLVFVNKVVGGSVPREYIPAVEKGVAETMEHGVLAGCPVIGCEVTLYDGGYHAVDSSEMAFRTAGREAFKKAFLEAKPVLLEPILNLEVHVPGQFMGDITGDLNSRRGRIQGMDQDGDLQVIKAQVPEAEMKTYSTDLRSMTGGEGSYSVDFSHYDTVPASVQQQIVAAIKKQQEEAS